jgi:hypothetical protein
MLRMGRSSDTWQAHRFTTGGRRFNGRRAMSALAAGQERRLERYLSSERLLRYGTIVETSIPKS